jgi:hypothetical protein
MILIFFINCILITTIINYIHNQKEIEICDIMLFVFVSLFICYTFPSLYVAVISKVRFDK